MCNDSFSKILAFIGALVLGVVAALLVYNGIFVEIAVVVLISLILAAVTAAFLLVLLFFAQHGRRCICRYASTLFYALMLTILLAAVLLMMPAGVAVPYVVVTGVWATLASFAIILFSMLVSCFITARCGCGSSGENRCGSSCRFG